MLFRSKKVCDAVKIPVIANGDVTDYKSAENILSKTGCDSLMIGRGALGNPFIFSEIKAGFEEKNYICDLNEKKRALIHHIELLEEYKPERLGAPEMRKHFAWYLKGIPHSNKLKAEVFTVKTYKEMKKLANQIF